MTTGSYKDLRVWRRAIDLAKEVYRLSSKLPGDEKYGLTSQLRRAVVSVASNIAEGAGRFNTGEFLRFLGVARGSLAEVDTQLTLCVELGLLPSPDKEAVDGIIAEVGKMINALRKSLNQTNN